MSVPAAKQLQRQATLRRLFHASNARSFPRRVVGIPAPPQLQKTGLLFDEDDTTGADEQDTNEGTSAGHIFLSQQRQVLHYMRLIEHDMPKLVQYRAPFVPPSSDRPLVVRSIDYGGEEHPATTKRTIVVPVSRLPLKNAYSIHNVKLLAGPRWSIKPPSDSGIALEERCGEHGYIKISCEDFPEPGMNLKWVSDALDRLVEQANLCGSKFVSVPIDTRHIKARRRKAKTGENLDGSRMSLRDFPQDWLPAEANLETVKKLDSASPYP